MAADGEIQSDMQAHERGYSLFVNMIKWGAIASFVVAAIVVVLISS